MQSGETIVNVGDAVIAHHVEGERAYAGSRPFDELAWSDVAARTFDRTTNVASSMTNHFLSDSGEPWRERLGSVRARTLVLHGTDDPFLPFGHGRAFADEIPGATLLAMRQTGHEPPPRPLWGEIIPALVTHTAATEATA